jgi:hypothetical protein
MSDGDARGRGARLGTAPAWASWKYLEYQSPSFFLADGMVTVVSCVVTCLGTLATQNCHRNAKEAKESTQRVTQPRTTCFYIAVYVYRDSAFVAAANETKDKCVGDFSPSILDTLLPSCSSKTPRFRVFQNSHVQGKRAKYV